MTLIVDEHDFVIILSAFVAAGSAICGLQGPTMLQARPQTLPRSTRVCGTLLLVLLFALISFAVEVDAGLEWKVKVSYYFFFLFGFATFFSLFRVSA